MDHGAAQVTLVEISFAVNTLGAVYEKLLDLISDQVTNSLNRSLGRVEALGEKLGIKVNQQLNNNARLLEEIADRRRGS